MIFSISATIQDGRQNLKSKHFRGPGEVILSTLGVQNLPEISLSLTFFEINRIFHLRQNLRRLDFRQV